jgi:2-dehydro-3-deoxyphosphogluconate aldolase/(4S)-4-hydroxy-2-oxoglutarate aldolase
MGDRIGIPSEIARGRVIAIVRGIGPDRILEVADALAAGGVRAIEVTLNSPGAIASISHLAARFGSDDLLIGAGTVITQDGLREAHAEGARFIVMPHTDPGLIELATSLGLASIPGASTPTEALVAWRAGASAVKAFPASVLGVGFVREMRGPLPMIPLVPTGGVTLESAPDFVRAGAVAVGMGSWLTGQGEPSAVSARAAQLIAALERAAEV